MMERTLEEADVEVPKTELVYVGEVVTCRCSEFEERSKKAEARCLELELEARKRKSEYEALETRFSTLEASKLALEDEIKVLKSRNEVDDRNNHNDNEKVVGYGGKEMIEGVVDLTEEEDEEEKNFQLVAENKALELEKSWAEEEAEVWKQKFKELESSMSQLQKSLASEGVERPPTTDANSVPVIDEGLNFTNSVSTLMSPGKGIGTPFNDTPYKGFTSNDGGFAMRNSKQVKRQSSFQEERSPGKQMAPSTPAGVKPASVGIIDIHESDHELKSVHNLSTSKREDVDGNISSKHELEGTGDSENETRITGDTISLVSVAKRKRTSNVVISDTESDDDDVPIGKLWQMRCEEVVPAATTSRIDNGRGDFTPQKRRLVSLRQTEEVRKHSSRKNNGSKSCKGTPTTKDVEDDNPDEIGSDSERDSDSLNDFIVEDNENIDCDNSSSESLDDSDSNDEHSGHEDVSSDGSGLEGASNDELSFNEILSQLKRNEDRKSDWKRDAELAAAFGKDPELCMRAVCALYRKQTLDEKLNNEGLYYNGIGFNKFDAGRGCTLGQFLTGGDPQGDLRKSVEELQAFDLIPDAVEVCRDLAIRKIRIFFLLKVPCN